jgi:hypothetical protein
MATIIHTTDPEFVAKSEHNFFDRFFLQYIIDVRDLPFIHLCLKMVFFIFPFVTVLYNPTLFNWWLAAIYLVVIIGYFLGPFILMLHNTSHRPLFKSDYKVLNNFIPWVLGPFMGESPETYFAHHMGMHHVENNMENDLSSTLKYNRDNVLHFHRYFFEFFFAGLIELFLYFTKRNRTQIRNWMTFGEFTYGVFVLILFFINWQATLVVFVIPFIVARYGMMAGNWAQHSFVDATDPENNYKNSITCINAVYNQKCFNDGYHIGHHLKANRHWTDLPRDFRENIEKYASNKAIVFRKLDFFSIWFFLMIKNYNVLANHYVQLDESNPLSKEEIIALLKQRTRRVLTQAR